MRSILIRSKPRGVLLFLTFLFLISSCNNTFDVLVYKSGKAYVKHKIEKSFPEDKGFDDFYFNDPIGTLQSFDSLYNYLEEVSSFKITSDSASYINSYYELSTIDSFGKLLLTALPSGPEINRDHLVQFYYSDSSLIISRGEINDTQSSILVNAFEKHQLGKLITFKLNLYFESKILAINSNVNFVRKVSNHIVSISFNGDDIERHKKEIKIEIQFK